MRRPGLTSDLIQLTTPYAITQAEVSVEDFNKNAPGPSLTAVLIRTASPGSLVITYDDLAKASIIHKLTLSNHLT